MKRSIHSESQVSDELSAEPPLKKQRITSAAKFPYELTIKENFPDTEKLCTAEEKHILSMKWGEYLSNSNGVLTAKSEVTQLHAYLLRRVEENALWMDEEGLLSAIQKEFLHYCRGSYILPLQFHILMCKSALEARTILTQIAEDVKSDFLVSTKLTKEMSTRVKQSAQSLLRLSNLDVKQGKFQHLDYAPQNRVPLHPNLEKVLETFYCLDFGPTFPPNKYDSWISALSSHKQKSSIYNVLLGLEVSGSGKTRIQIEYANQRRHSIYVPAKVLRELQSSVENIKNLTRTDFKSKAVSVLYLTIMVYLICFENTNKEDNLAARILTVVKYMNNRAGEFISDLLRRKEIVYIDTNTLDLELDVISKRTCIDIHDFVIIIDEAHLFTDAIPCPKKGTTIGGTQNKDIISAIITTSNLSEKSSKVWQSSISSGVVAAQKVDQTGTIEERAKRATDAFRAALRNNQSPEKPRIVEAARTIFRQLCENQSSVLTETISIGREICHVLLLTTRISTWQAVEHTISGVGERTIFSNQEPLPPIFAHQVMQFLSNYLDTDNIPTLHKHLIARMVQGPPRTCQMFVQKLLKNLTELQDMRPLLDKSIIDTVLEREPVTQETESLLKKISAYGRTEQEQAAIEFALFGIANVKSLHNVHQTIAATGISYTMNVSKKQVYNISMKHQVLFQQALENYDVPFQVKSTNIASLAERALGQMLATALEQYIEPYANYLNLDVGKIPSGYVMFDSPTPNDADYSPHHRLSVLMVEQLKEKLVTHETILESMVVKPGDEAGFDWIRLLRNSKSNAYTPVIASVTLAKNDPTRDVDDYNRTAPEFIWRRRDGSKYNETQKFETECEKISSAAVRAFRRDGGKAIRIMFAPFRTLDEFVQAINKADGISPSMVGDATYTNKHGDLVIHIGDGSPHWERMKRKTEPQDHVLDSLMTELQALLPNVHKTHNLP